MKALVVYDSFFGNTELVARAVAESLGAAAVRVAEAKPEALAGVELLVVGSPTRAFRPSPETLAFLTRIPVGSLAGVRVAGFDTRIAEADMPAVLRLIVRVFGYAAKPIVARLRRLGGTVAAEPAGFIVKGKEGPLAEGELERAQVWARQIAETTTS
uniref:Flavodoxin family protein n=1 Tax=candidate division WOR-3 bacterium TaxID=2052148 RepID=A0A7C4CAH9_UNCW3